MEAPLLYSLGSLRCAGRFRHDVHIMLDGMHQSGEVV